MMKNKFRLKEIQEKKSTLANETLHNYTLSFQNEDQEKQIELAGLGKIREAVQV